MKTWQIADKAFGTIKVLYRERKIEVKNITSKMGDILIINLKRWDFHSTKRDKIAVGIPEIPENLHKKEGLKDNFREKIKIYKKTYLSVTLLNIDSRITCIYNHYLHCTWLPSEEQFVLEKEKAEEVR